MSQMHLKFVTLQTAILHMAKSSVSDALSEELNRISTMSAINFILEDPNGLYECGYLQPGHMDMLE